MQRPPLSNLDLRTDSSLISALWAQCGASDCSQGVTAELFVTLPTTGPGDGGRHCSGAALLSNSRGFCTIALRPLGGRPCAATSAMRDQAASSTHTTFGTTQREKLTDASQDLSAERLSRAGMGRAWTRSLCIRAACLWPHLCENLCLPLGMPGGQLFWGSRRGWVGRWVQIPKGGVARKLTGIGLTCRGGVES